MRSHLCFLPVTMASAQLAATFAATTLASIVNSGHNATVMKTKACTKAPLHEKRANPTGARQAPMPCDPANEAEVAYRRLA